MGVSGRTLFNDPALCLLQFAKEYAFSSLSGWKWWMAANIGKSGLVMLHNNGRNGRGKRQRQDNMD